ncbi:hypothetical protein JHK85_013729 [Glycine max]|nr:hypothetical protein JHK87_013285 [Glycine soja]KAG5041253.1 hypothetical protein JHK85_013729 [Glycine max]
MKGVNWRTLYESFRWMNLNKLPNQETYLICIILHQQSIILNQHALSNGLTTKRNTTAAETFLYIERVQLKLKLRSRETFLQNKNLGLTQLKIIKTIVEGLIYISIY